MKDLDDIVERVLQGVPIKVLEQERLVIVTPNMTAEQYAAIHLKVPRSGNEDIDAMIRQSRRVEFARAVIDVFFDRPTTNKEHIAADARNCFAFADVILTEWEKKTEK